MVRSMLPMMMVIMVIPEFMVTMMGAIGEGAIVTTAVVWS